MTFYPAGKLVVMVEKAKNLQFPDTYKPPTGDLSRIDPFATLLTDGRASKIEKRTPADKDGGSDPVWNALITFSVVDQISIEMQVYHQSVPPLADILLGTCTISLLTVFRNGHYASWNTLKQKKANGGYREVGDVFLDLKFEGPVGLAFPQARTDVDSFDDTIRRVYPQGIITEEEENKWIGAGQDKPIPPEISTIPSPKSRSTKQASGGEVEQEEDEDELSKKLKTTTVEQVSLFGLDSSAKEGAPEFTEEEIVAAFQFLDLDHNNFLGAAEIRHILVCMGEMITDEEIDTMISMVDLDGDGQVSLAEFRALVLHPDPSNMGHAQPLPQVIVGQQEEELRKEKQALAGKTTGLDLKAFQRQKELTAREAKKKMLSAFAVDNEVTFDFIRHAYENYLSLPIDKRAQDRIRFPEFCQALEVEPLHEYKILHGLFDHDELGNIDFREFLLSLMNFIEVDRERRIRFSFQMFDPRKTGYITQKEVEEILRGNHMISLASVQRKAQTVMKQATVNSVGSITINEFVVISKKFPNILLPSVHIQGAKAVT